jgi:hypothetical protein
MAKSRLKLVAPTEVNRTVAPVRRPNAELRTREHLTLGEVEALVEAAKANRHGHRDATMILVAFRHGLRTAEACGETSERCRPSIPTNLATPRRIAPNTTRAALFVPVEVLASARGELELAGVQAGALVDAMEPERSGGGDAATFCRMRPSGFALAIKTLLTIPT